MKLLRGVISFLKDTFYYLIAVPILFLVNKFVLGYKLIGKENIKKVPGAKITISNHVHTIDCSMNGLVSFPQYCYFVTLQSNIDLPFIGKLVRLLRGIPIPLKISEKEKFYEEISNLLKNGETVHIYPAGMLRPYATDLLQFKKGAFAMAVENNVPIVPSVILTREPEGIYKYFKKKPLFTQVVLEPIYPDLTIENKGERIKKMLDEAYTKMKDQLDNNGEITYEEEEVKV